MPQVWIAIFFILLAVTELYQSIKEIDLPFPVYLVLGSILAIASNYQHKVLCGQAREITPLELGIAPVLKSTQLPVLPTPVNHDAKAYGSIDED